jgi:acetyl-CoA/propionyl-CoA carboxylase biotin carboxyl carrier protein
MVAKLIVTGSSREEALARSRRALEEMQVHGLPTVLPFHRAIVNDAAFTAANGKFGVYTRWIETDWENTLEPWSGQAEDVGSEEPRQNVVVEVSGKRLEVSLPKRLLVGEIGSAAGHAPKRTKSSHASSHTGAKGNSLLAPMQSTVVKLSVSEGQHVEEGELVVVLEAMKMEQPLTAHRSGTISSIGVQVGTTISAGTRILDIVD